MEDTRTVLRRSLLYFRNVYIGRDMIPRSMQAILDFMMEFEVLKARASAALTCCICENSCWKYPLLR